MLLVQLALLVLSQQQVDSSSSSSFCGREIRPLERSASAAVAFALLTADAATSSYQNISHPVTDCTIKTWSYAMRACVYLCVE